MIIEFQETNFDPSKYKKSLPQKGFLCHFSCFPWLNAIPNDSNSIIVFIQQVASPIHLPKKVDPMSFGS